MRVVCIGAAVWKQEAPMAAHQEIDRLSSEHMTLMRAHAKAQARCSALLRAQAAHIAAIEAQLIRARAAAIRAQTALAWERSEERRVGKECPV